MNLSTHTHPLFLTMGVTAVSQRRKQGRLLNEGDLVSQDLKEEESFEISLIAGQAWITLEGDAEDYIVRVPKSLHLMGPGRVVIEALEDATEICWPNHS